MRKPAMRAMRRQNVRAALKADHGMPRCASVGVVWKLGNPSATSPEFSYTSFE